MKPFQLNQDIEESDSQLDERSYIVETPNGETYRPNRLHLKKTKENADIPNPETALECPEPTPNIP
jgi:hypothetical protein